MADQFSNTGFNRLMIALLQWLINFLTGGLEEKIFMEKYITI